MVQIREDNDWTKLVLILTHSLGVFWVIWTLACHNSDPLAGWIKAKLSTLPPSPSMASPQLAVLVRRGWM